jgi:hypothetical protein
MEENGRTSLAGTMCNASRIDSAMQDSSTAPTQKATSPWSSASLLRPAMRLDVISPLAASRADMDSWLRKSKTFSDGVIFCLSDAGGRSVSARTLNLNSGEPFLMTDLWAGDGGWGGRVHHPQGWKIGKENET